MPKSTDQRRRDADVAELRVEHPGGWLEDHFCGLCRCTKSGWTDVPNMTFDWCEDHECPCHEDVDAL